MRVFYPNPRGCFLLHIRGLLPLLLTIPYYPLLPIFSIKYSFQKPLFSTKYTYKMLHKPLYAWLNLLTYIAIITDL
jgi:hypothetical protein